uniref:Serpin family B member 3 n=1 Tax=Panthera leo TaxID=9689 RepID=A0A8C8XI75_PANLE
MDSLSEANTHFALDLFQQFKPSKKNDNIFYSPLSIASALAMTYLGAKENTALEIGKVGVSCLHTDQPRRISPLAWVQMTTDPAAQHRRLGKHSHNWVSTELWGKFYLASVESVDFQKAAEETRKKINSWVESQTNGKIKDLLPENSLESTVLVLVNAVYFKGLWDKKFDKKYTVEEKFWLNKDTSKPVQMMKQSSVFNFTSLEDVQAKILEMPYKGKDLSMMLLLPNENHVGYQLTAEKLAEWTSSQNMSDRWVDLYLPRFKVEDDYDLKATLQALGMLDAFNTQRANFSGMTGSLDLAVSKALHKSFVEVTEEGTEATASTDVNAGYTSLPTYHFRCDHPFLFFIKHNKTNCILFLGRVSSP